MKKNEESAIAQISVCPISGPVLEARTSVISSDDKTELADIFSSCCMMRVLDSSRAHSNFLARPGESSPRLISMASSAGL